MPRLRVVQVARQTGHRRELQQLSGDTLFNNAFRTIGPHQHEYHQSNGACQCGEAKAIGRVSPRNRAPQSAWSSSTVHRSRTLRPHLAIDRLHGAFGASLAGGSQLFTSSPSSWHTDTAPDLSQPSHTATICSKPTTTSSRFSTSCGVGRRERFPSSPPPLVSSRRHLSPEPFSLHSC